MSSCKVWSSDSHIIEPADLWEKRIDPKFRDRAPHLVHEEDMDQWYCDGVPFGVIGDNQQAGLRYEAPEKLTLGGSMADAPMGGLDPHVHVKEMDVDGITGGVLYPSQGLTLWDRIPASDLLSAIFRAYNDYIGEFCQPYPDRLKGIALVNVDDVEDGVSELNRAAKMGLSGAMIATKPMLRYNHPAYERLWATAQDLGMPLSLHIGTNRWRPGVEMDITLQDHTVLVNGDFDVRQCIADMIISGTFERYPKLKVGAVEFEVAWAPYFLQRLDIWYSERAAGVHGNRLKTGMMPSDYFRSNVFIGFQEDDLGMQTRQSLGPDCLVWGSDYPHAESTYPKSLEIIDRIMQGVPEEEKARIVGENTAQLYHFN